MAMDYLEPRLEAPIPGMGMTHELGARPWQQPAQYTKMEDIVDYYVSSMSDDSFQKQLVNVISTDVPLTSLANTIQLAGVMQGIHSIDSGILVTPVIMELMMLIAEQNDTKFVIGTERNKKEEVKESVIQAALVEFEKESNKEADDMEETTDNVEELDMPIEEQEPMSGLMSRRDV
tara:strand:+ start:1204 stop:1731 length:528 start_codon:yes stop_codon:yes gene_type:complete